MMESKKIRCCFIYLTKTVSKKKKYDLRHFIILLAVENECKKIDSSIPLYKIKMTQFIYAFGTLYL